MNEITIDEQWLNEKLADYLKHNLKIEIETKAEDYSRKVDTVKVKILLNDTIISESSDSL